MNSKLVNRCIKNAIDRVEIKRNRMNIYSYISYFCRRNYMPIEEEFYIRKHISNYIDKHSTEIFPTDFTINGIAF